MIKISTSYTCSRFKTGIQAWWKQCFLIKIHKGNHINYIKLKQTWTGDLSVVNPASHLNSAGIGCSYSVTLMRIHCYRNMKNTTHIHQKGVYCLWHKPACSNETAASCSRENWRRRVWKKNKSQAALFKKIIYYRNKNLKNYLHTL